MLDYLLSEEWKNLVKALQRVPIPYRHLTASFLFPDSVVMTYDRVKLSRHFGFEFSEKDFEDFQFYFMEQESDVQSLERVYWKWQGWREYHSAELTEDSQ